jgi:hypothetical protein
MFKNRAIFLIVISAILIPLIFIADSLIPLATFSFLFILAQVIMLYLFYKEAEVKFEHWYVFWTAVLSLVFMLVLVLIGKNAMTEFLGLLLFLIYFIGLLILLFKGRFKRKPKQASQRLADSENKSFLKQKNEEIKKSFFEEKIKDEDLESFREKDELAELVEFFEPGVRKDVRVVDIEEPRIENIFYERVDEEEEKPSRKKIKEAEKVLKEELGEDEQDWRGELPKSVIYDYEEAKPTEELQVKEIKETPKVDFQKVKENLQKIDEGVKTISEKIRLISEKAILEGAEKKLRALQAKRQPKPKKKELKVFASKTGTKFHYKRDCLGLKRVKTKDLVSYTNSGDAKKKGLKPCDLCK